MIIKFSCKNRCLDFAKTEEELRNEKVITHCPYCGEKLSVQNIDEVVNDDIQKIIESNVTAYYRTMGLEATAEMIDRLKDGKVKNLYQTELRKRKLIR
jgi:thioredoxin reductase